LSAALDGEPVGSIIFNAEPKAAFASATA